MGEGRGWSPVVAMAGRRGRISPGGRSCTLRSECESSNDSYWGVEYNLPSLGYPPLSGSSGIGAEEGVWKFG